ncbi:MAG TPA: ATP-binding protein [Candidatus Sulfotelmatobacter sp.]|nr:ATP-binding protein [Candidatus Sulfotelmatobacter sp.]
MPWPPAEARLARGLADLSRLAEWDMSPSALGTALLDLLVPLLELDLAYIAVPDRESVHEAARLLGVADPLAGLRRTLAPWLGPGGPTGGTISDPRGVGRLSLAALHAGEQWEVVLLAGAAREGFPEALAAGLLALAGAQAALAVAASQDRAAVAMAVQDLARERAARERVETLLAERAQDLATAERRKNDFLAVLAHELRNPLAPLRNGIELLRRLAPSAPGLQQTQEMLERQVSHLARLIDDLLDLARVGRGQVLLRTESLEATELVRQVLEDHEAAVAAKDLRLEATLPAGALWVAGDHTRLTQVVGHLLTNAVDFTPPGGRIQVALAREGARFRLTVSDSGVGVEPALLARIFEGFHPEAAGGDGGLGLGLSLVKGLVELHGGAVQASSPGRGAGATFTVWLPLTAAPVRREIPAPPVVAGEGRRVLIIEDKPDTAHSLRLLLETFGHRVALADHGQAGLALAREFLPDVVLCDIGLPKGMDGYAVARAFRREARLARAYLIAVTGYGEEKDRRRSEDAGFDLHITKPLDPRRLEQVLAALPLAAGGTPYGGR